MKLAIRKWDTETWKSMIIDLETLKVVSSDYDEKTTETIYKNLPTFFKDGKRNKFEDDPIGWAEHYSKMQYTYSRFEIIS